VVANNSDEFVRISHLSKTFGIVKAVRDVSFTVAQGTMVSLLGPSGCGKTTVLRCIAGLETPSSGSISIRGVTVSDINRGIQVPPDKRSIGMVFQSYAIWPHMTVFKNISFPLRLRRENSKMIQEKVERILGLLGLADFADRPATNLSGGQQQRVALGRALVAEPQLVLFDEPLSNLDAKLRERMRVELLTLQERLGFTAIYVTHDQQEALALSDQLIIMNGGVIEQLGSPLETYKNPRSAFVADFMGASNLIKGRVVERTDPPYVRVEIDGVDGDLLCHVHDFEIKPMTPVIVSFRPGSTQVVMRKTEGREARGRDNLNQLSGSISASLFLGEYYEYSIQLGSVSIKANSRSTDPFPKDSPVYIQVAKENCLAIPGNEPINQDP
jgi:iron(III) transport system ATP-binding protein